MLGTNKSEILFNFTQCSQLGLVCGLVHCTAQVPCTWAEFGFLFVYLVCIWLFISVPGLLLAVHQCTWAVSGSESTSEYQSLHQFSVPSLSTSVYLDCIWLYICVLGLYLVVHQCTWAVSGCTLVYLGCILLYIGVH